MALPVGGRSALLEVHKYLEDVYLPAVEQDARPVARSSFLSFAFREPRRSTQPDTKPTLPLRCCTVALGACNGVSRL